MANSDVLVRMKADTKNYDANIAKARRQLEQFKKDNLSFGGVMKQTTSAMTGMAMQFASVAAAIGATKKVVGDMIRINKQFEQSTANLASIIGKSVSDISALTTQAKQLGATTRYTAMQITELQTNLARLGFTQQEILNSTTAVQAFATATGADLGEAANLAGAALRGFGLNATEMERVASVLSVSTTKSALSFEKLATAIPIVAPVAKQFGFTIEDTVTLLAKLSDAGMDASTAATATRNIFLKMANDSGKLSQALGRPVHSVEEFGEALKEMRSKGMSLNDILSMVGVRSTAAFAVFADNAETLKDFKDSITDCGDAMHDMENKQLNTLQGSITILNSAWEGLMLSFSESNGIIKDVVDALTNLLSAWTRWRNRNKGGDAAIATYELGANAEDAQKYIDEKRSQGVNDKGIKAQAEADKEALEDEIEELKKLEALYGEYDKFLNYFDYRNPAHQKKNEDYIAAFKAAGRSATNEARTQLQKDIAAKIDKTATLNIVVGKFTPAQSTTSTSGQGSQEGGSNISKLRAQYEAQEKEQIASLDRQSMTEEEYEEKVYEIKRATIERIAKLYDEDSKEYAQVMAKKYSLDIQYQGTQMRLANKNKKDEETTKSLLEQRKERIEKITDALKEMNDVLNSTADDNTKAWATEQIKQYNAELDKLNGKLPETANNIKNVKDSWGKLSEGVSAFGSITGAMDGLKSSVEGLAEAFNGEKDAWDSMMAVMNTGISVLQTFITLHEALNTIKSLSTTLTKAQTAAQQEETITTVTGAAQVVAAEGTKATASGIAAGANAAEASTAAGESVAKIPIIGPILAVAAIAAVLAATMAAISKSKSAGKFASGGIVGGNSYSGDQVVAMLNSGEGVLTQQGVQNAGAILSSTSGTNITVSGKVRGSDILLAIDNSNSSRGGHRGIYANVR